MPASGTLGLMKLPLEISFIIASMMNVEDIACLSMVHELLYSVLRFTLTNHLMVHSVAIPIDMFLLILESLPKSFCLVQRTISGC